MKLKEKKQVNFYNKNIVLNNKIKKTYQGIE